MKNRQASEQPPLLQFLSWLLTTTIEDDIDSTATKISKPAPYNFDREGKLRNYSTGTLPPRENEGSEADPERRRGPGSIASARGTLGPVLRDPVFARLTPATWLAFR